MKSRETVSARSPVVRGLALCQGVLGCFAAFLLLVLVWSPGANVDRGRAIGLAVGALVLGVLHLWLLGMAVVARQAGDFDTLYRLAVWVTGFIAGALVITSIAQPSNAPAALVTGIFLLPMPVAIVILLRRIRRREWGR